MGKLYLLTMFFGVYVEQQKLLYCTARKNVLFLLYYYVHCRNIPSPPPPSLARHQGPPSSIAPLHSLSVLRWPFEMAKHLRNGRDNVPSPLLIPRHPRRRYPPRVVLESGRSLLRIEFITWPAACRQRGL